MLMIFVWRVDADVVSMANARLSLEDGRSFLVGTKALSNKNRM